MAKYHIGRKGNPTLCRAKNGNCPFGAESEHYESKEEAQKHLENKNMNTVLQGTKRKGNTETITGKSQTVSQNNIDVLEDYNVYRLLTNTMHNSTESYSGVELYYYSTETGQRELARRGRSRYDKKRIDEVKEAIDSLKGKRIQEITDEHRKEYNDRADRGQSLVEKGEFFDRSNQDIRAYVTRESLKQLKTLSADEVEVVSHYTSNGSFIARKEGLGEEGEQERIVNTMKKVFQKIEPREDIPKIYRGTSYKYIPENPQVGDTFKAANDGLPVCSALSEDVASSFDKGIMLEMNVKKAKMIIPGAVSAWGAYEQEVLLDGNAEFQIKEIKQGERMITYVLEQVNYDKE